MSRAAGIDVGVAKGCDLVVIEDRAVVAHRAGLAPRELRPAVAVHRPDIVCIDAPRDYAVEGSTRACERELLRRGIRLFVTPCESKAQSSWYDWMRVGFACFDALAELGPFEAFPHATCVVLDGGPPDRSVAKRDRRRATLERQGVDTSTLRTIDAIDAALCALTGILSIEGTACRVGEPDEGLLLVPR